MVHRCEIKNIVVKRAINICLACQRQFACLNFGYFSSTKELNAVINKYDTNQEARIVEHVHVEHFLACFVSIHYQTNVLHNDNDKQQRHLILNRLINKRQWFWSYTDVHNPSEAHKSGNLKDRSWKCFSQPESLIFALDLKNSNTRAHVFQLLEISEHNAKRINNHRYNGEFPIISYRDNKGAPHDHERVEPDPESSHHKG